MNNNERRVRKIREKAGLRYITVHTSNCLEQSTAEDIVN